MGTPSGAAGGCTRPRRRAPAASRSTRAAARRGARAGRATTRCPPCRCCSAASASRWWRRTRCPRTRRRARAARSRPEIVGARSKSAARPSAQVCLLEVVLFTSEQSLIKLQGLLQREIASHAGVEQGSADSRQAALLQLLLNTCSLSLSVVCGADRAESAEARAHSGPAPARPPPASHPRHLTAARADRGGSTRHEGAVPRRGPARGGKGGQLRRAAPLDARAAPPIPRRVRRGGDGQRATRERPRRLLGRPRRRALSRGQGEPRRPQGAAPHAGRGDHRGVRDPQADLARRVWPRGARGEEDDARSVRDQGAASPPSSPLSPACAPARHALMMSVARGAGGAQEGHASEEPRGAREGRARGDGVSGAHVRCEALLLIPVGR